MDIEMKWIYCEHELNSAAPIPLFLIGKSTLKFEGGNPSSWFLAEIIKQEEYYKQKTFNMSTASVVNKIVRLASKTAGHSCYSAIESGFNDRNTDLSTRNSFKGVSLLLSVVVQEGYLGHLFSSVKRISIT